MPYYRGYVYFKNGTKQEVSNGDNERAVEQNTYRKFEELKRQFSSPGFEYHLPTRYEVREER